MRKQAPTRRASIAAVSAAASLPTAAEEYGGRNAEIDPSGPMIE
jgi:hypothetical protein